MISIAPILTLLCAQQLPSDQVVGWRDLLTRLGSAPVEYQVEVSWVSISLSGVSPEDANVAALALAHAGEGEGTYEEAAEAFLGLAKAGSVDGVHVEPPVDYRFARSGERLVLECLRSSATQIVIGPNVSVAYDTRRNSLVVEDPRPFVMRFQPEVLIQPLPSGATMDSWLDGTWEYVSKGTYRNHYQEDRSHRRATVRIGRGGAPDAFWVRPRPDEASILAGFYTWEGGGDARSRPANALYLTMSGDLLKGVHYRVQNWVEPIDVERTILPIRTPVLVVDSRGGKYTKIASFAALPPAIREMFVLTDE